MTEHQSSRTLVKSAPELWAECSDAASLARHLGAFGEIRITKLEPETAVAWEGAAASGTVRLESSGWGTRVTLTVTEEAPPAEPEPEPVAAEPVAEAPEPEPVAEAPEPEPVAEEPEPEPEPEPELVTTVAAPRRGMFARLFRRKPGADPAPVIEVDGDPEPVIEIGAKSESEPEPETATEPEPVAEMVPEPVAEPEPAPAPDPDQSASPQPPGENALAAALDSLGMAHHRPYSRA
ncbi:MAG TPA: hypothetical protein VGG07_02710 [Solirubrobacteraceae bacterium]